MKAGSKGWRWVIVLLVLVVAAVVIFHYLHSTKKPAAPRLVTPVTAVAAQLADVPVYIDALGTVTPTRTVAVITQVNGILNTVNFKEGQRVKAGQVIATIDS